MGSRGVWASVECLLEDSEGELDKSLHVRRPSPMLLKGKLKLEDNEFAQGHTGGGRARTKIQDSVLKKVHLLRALKKCLLSFVAKITKGEAGDSILY